LHFWSIDGATLSRKQGRFGRKYKQQPLLCSAALRQKDDWQLVVGTSSGDLYVFSDRECSNAIEKAHAGAVLSLREVRTEATGGDMETCDVDFLVSGGKDMFIKIWNQALQPISAFSLAVGSVGAGILGSLDGSVGSVDYRFVDGDMVVLAGTYGGEVFEVRAGKADGAAKGVPSDPKLKNMNISTASKPNVLLRSHFSGELWGLAAHPLDPDLFVTGGDDGAIKLWSISRCSLLCSLFVGWPVRAMAWHPEGGILAVGLNELERGGGGGKKLSKGGSKTKGTAASGSSEGSGTPSGVCQLYTFHQQGAEYSFVKIAEGCESKATVADMKFSPSGKYLAIGTHDKKLFKYVLNESAGRGDVPAWAGSLRNPKIFNKHSSAVLHVDFSEDELWMQSTCQAYELLFSEAGTAQQVTSASKLANYNSQRSDDRHGEWWATWTCPLGWPVQGIWAAGADGSDINAVDRSHSRLLLASADDYGLVKLFRYPCVSEGAKYVACTGHSSHVTCVRWSRADHLISVGGNDKCVFVWEVATR